MAVEAETVERGPQESVSQGSEEAVGSNWFRSNVIGRGNGSDAPEPTESSTDDTSDATSEQSSTPTLEGGNADTGESKDSSQGSTRTQSQTFTVTAEQLDTAFARRLETELQNKYVPLEEMERRIQSEVDRRYAKQKRDARAEERRRLREEDPVAFIELDRQQEQEDAQERESTSTALEQFQRTAQTIRDTTLQYDENVLTPIMLLLPATDRAEIDKAAAKYVNDPLAHRKQLTLEALKRIEKNAETRAEARLRKSDAFKKQLLLDLRGTEEEPDILEGVAGQAFPASFDMNAELRAITGRGPRR